MTKGFKTDNKIEPKESETKVLKKPTVEVVKEVNSEEHFQNKSSSSSIDALYNESVEDIRMQVTEELERKQKFWNKFDLIERILCIDPTLEVFKFNILSEVSFLHPEKTKLKNFNLFLLKLERSNDFNEEQLANILLIVPTLSILKLERSIEVKLVHPLNIESTVSTVSVLKFVKLIYDKDLHP